MVVGGGAMMKGAGKDKESVKHKDNVWTFVVMLVGFLSLC
jgi:hypothetical protein